LLYFQLHKAVHSLFPDFLSFRPNKNQEYIIMHCDSESDWLMSSNRARVDLENSMRVEK